MFSLVPFLQLVYAAFHSPSLYCLTSDIGFFSQQQSLKSFQISQNITVILNVLVALYLSQLGNWYQLEISFIRNLIFFYDFHCSYQIGISRTRIHKYQRLSQVMKHLETSARAPLQSAFTENFIRKSSPCHQVPHTQRKTYVTIKLSFWNPDLNILQAVTLIQLKLLSKAQPTTISFTFHGIHFSEWVLLRVYYSPDRVRTDLLT